MATELDLRRLVDYLERRRPAYLADLRDLVNTDSGTFDKQGVDQVGAWLRSRYTQLGAELEIYPHQVYGDTFSALVRGSATGKLLLLGHLDTVYPHGTSAKRPFRVEGERAYGPGIADMKAGNLSIVYAVEALQALHVSSFGRITVVHNSDEEVGSPTSRDLIRTGAEDADAVLVLEAGRENGNIVCSRKGVVDFRLHVRGRSAHAGVNHQGGRSAALELAHIVIGLEGLNGQVPGATLNVGRLEGGERSNVVPDYAFAHFEARAFETDRLHEMIAHVQEIVAQRTVPDTEAKLEVSIDHLPMPWSDGSRRLLHRAQAIAHRLGFRVEGVATGGASDGNTAAAAGRPVLDGLGPIGGRAHSPNEYLDVSSIVPRTALLAAMIASIEAPDW